MSVDYEIYLSENLSQEVLSDFGFVEESRTDEIIRGYAFDGDLLFVIAKCSSSDGFIREEVGFGPRIKLILSPELDNYDESMNATIKVINVCIDKINSIKFYQNNEVLLLEKKDKKIILYNHETSWWNHYFNILEFDFTEK
jgi:hypothetical protein